MAQRNQSKPTINVAAEHPRILGWAGGLLFALGLAAAFLAFIQHDTGAKVSMVLNATVLLSMGYPMLLYVRALTRIAELEQRIRNLEQSPKD
jgi:hypothetical protein